LHDSRNDQATCHMRSDNTDTFSNYVQVRKTMAVGLKLMRLITHKAQFYDM